MVESAMPARGPTPITRRYRSFEDARNVVVRLAEQGIPAERIGLVGRQMGGDDNAAAGAGIGSAAGAATGFVLSIGALSLPGVGPVIAAGWFLGGAAAGAVAGGIVGALIDAGVPEADASRQSQALNDGSALVAVRAEPQEATLVEAIMDAGLPIAASPGIAGRQAEPDDPVDLSKVVS